VKRNETRRIGAIFACFYVARVSQRQLGFLVIIGCTNIVSDYKTRCGASLEDS